MIEGHSGVQFHVIVNCRNHIKFLIHNMMTLPLLFLSQPSYSVSSHNIYKLTCRAPCDLHQRSSQLIIHHHQSSIFASNFTSLLSPFTSWHNHTKDKKSFCLYIKWCVEHIETLARLFNNKHVAPC